MSFSHTFSSSSNPRNPASPAPPQNAQAPDAILRMLNTIIGGAARQPHPATRDATTQSPDGEPNVRVFTGGGPNFQYTATTRLTPRDANTPQARVPTIDNLPGILNHMFQAPPRGAGPDPNFEPLGFGNLLNTLFNPANMQHGDAVYISAHGAESIQRPWSCLGRCHCRFAAKAHHKRRLGRNNRKGRLFHLHG
jgi:E3 ubiquitin-protein ligase RNF115/126